MTAIRYLFWCATRWKWKHWRDYNKAQSDLFGWKYFIGIRHLKVVPPMPRRMEAKRANVEYVATQFNVTEYLANGGK